MSKAVLRFSDTTSVWATNLEIIIYVFTWFGSSEFYS